VESPSVPPPGSLLADKYRVQEVLGQGGMGVVLAATHELLATPVAIKVMSAQALEQENAIPRFLREARAAAGLKSEYVARVTDFGTLADGRPFMVMELLSGQDLSAIHKGEGLTRTEWIDAILQACAGLAEAHVAGIVHRDLKLANFFRTRRPDGSHCTKILDFGISKLAKADGLTDTTTKSTNLLGTPYYMSPEHVRSSRDVDARSDIWQMGVALYQVMTGYLPFDGDNVGMLFARILEIAPRPPSGLAPDLPEPIEKAILACLEKDPARRPATIAQLAAWLEPFAGPEGRLAAQRARAMQSALLATPPVASIVLTGNPHPGGVGPEGSAPAASATSGFGPTAPAIAPRSEWTDAPVSTSITKPSPPLSLIAIAIACVLAATGAIVFFAARGPSNDGLASTAEPSTPTNAASGARPAALPSDTNAAPASSAPAASSSPSASAASSAASSPPDVRPARPGRPQPAPPPPPTAAKPATPERPTLH
jgi:serine/threonine protein kinase